MIEYTVTVYSSGHKDWWLNNKRHREDGAAVEYADGTKEWWLDGNHISEAEFNVRMRRHVRMRRQFDGTTINIGGVKYKLEAVKGLR